MKEIPRRKLAIVIERRSVESRWETHHWELFGTVPDPGGEPRVILEDASRLQRLHPGFEVALYPDETEGYFLNATSEQPSVFVSVRIPEEGGDPYPFQATLSYNEAARWMDGGEKVERVPAWPELAAWMAEWVDANYRPEPKKRRRPRSFEGQGNLREEKG